MLNVIRAAVLWDAEIYDQSWLLYKKLGTPCVYMSSKD